MYLESRTVSRKTPGDGKLEVSAPTFRALAGAGDALHVELAGSSAAARMEAMTCSCAKSDGAHEHHFLVSDLLRALVPETRVRLDLDGRQLKVSVTPE